MEGVEVLFGVEVGEEVCERKHIAISRRAARSAVGDPSFCRGVDSAGTWVPATFRAAASLRSVVFSLNSLSFNAFRLATSLVSRSLDSNNFCILPSISSIFAFFLSRDVCAATRFFSFLFKSKYIGTSFCIVKNVHIHGKHEYHLSRYVDVVSWIK